MMREAISMVSETILMMREAISTVSGAISMMCRNFQKVI